MLRSEDVADKTFTTTRLREGYEIAEVDCFRTDVVEAIALRDKVITDLQAELAAARTRPADQPVEAVREDAGPRESSAAAARLLEMATLNADQLVAEAQAEAERVGAELEQHRATLEAKIADLRRMESEHRDRLRQVLTDQLAQLEDGTPAPPLAAVGD